LPEWNAGLAFLPVIVYNFMGFELMSGASGEMKNPGKDIPRAIITSGALIAVFYLLGTIGILMALPLDQIGLVSGIVDTLKVLLGDTGVGGIIVIVLGVAALYSFLANMVTWTMGANRTAAEAAKENELRQFSQRNTPFTKPRPAPSSSPASSPLLSWSFMVSWLAPLKISSGRSSPSVPWSSCCPIWPSSQPSSNCAKLTPM
jgi:amino acid transporter